jgi:His/Glu/Gln/Arg/opine family amino acid ABC transporter permease subunit
LSGYALDWNAVLQNLPRLLDGAWIAFELVVVAGIGATAIGIGGACARLSRNKFLSRGALVFLEAMRNSPTLVKMYFIYFGMPSIGIYPSPFVAGAIALAIHNGAYMMEVFRAAIVAVPIGQRHAAASLGLKPRAAFTNVILPQAMRNALPPLGNIWAELVKDTSLTSAISVEEIYFVFVSIIALTMRTYEFFIVGAAFYLLATSMVALAMRLLEHRLSHR